MFKVQATDHPDYFRPCLIFAGKAGAYRRGGLTGLLTKDTTLALPVNIEQGLSD